MPAVMVMPVAIIAQRNRIKRRFVEAGACSPGTARTLEELGVERGHLVGRMMEGGVIKEVAGGRFWVDQSADAAFHRRALLYVACAVGLLVLAGLVAVLIFR